MISKEQALREQNRRLRVDNLRLRDLLAESRRKYAELSAMALASVSARQDAVLADNRILDMLDEDGGDE